MISRFFNGLIEQTFNGLETSENNIAMVCYSNDFSVLELSSIKRYSESDSVFLSCHEFEHGKMTSAYEPFIKSICDMHREVIGGDFGDFLDECDVYMLQKDMLISYYETGMCVRKEAVLLDEVEYERVRLAKTMRLMLEKIAAIKPYVMVINRFQKASLSSVQLIRMIIDNPVKNFGMVLGINEGQVQYNLGIKHWESVRSALDNVNMVYHVGNTGIKNSYVSSKHEKPDLELVYKEAVNIFELLDYDTADEYYRRNNYLWLEKYDSEEELTLLKIALEYTNALILSGNMPKALDLIDIVSQRLPQGYEHEVKYQVASQRALSYAYQGKLDKALCEVKKAKEEASIIGDEELIFKAELLDIESKMSGWHNLLFVAKDIQIDQGLLGKLMKYGYKNYLAHIYVYCYDNGPEVVAMAYRSEAFLKYFSQGISLAKEIGNEVLIYNAYQKNIMIAATNGMNDIALLFDVRMYEALKDKKSLDSARVLSSIGYNLSAVGYNEEASNFYNRAIELLYELQEAPDIAEVLYNMGINDLSVGNYAEAERCFHFVLKIVDKLRMNSIRVCTLSKLYALMALVNIMQKKFINSERYLINCKRFLNYIIEKDNEKENREVLHDYALTDDDQYLYNFAAGYKAYLEGAYDKSLEYYSKANKHFMVAEGNQYYTAHSFHVHRLELFEKIGRTDLYDSEENISKKYDETVALLKRTTSLDIIKDVEIEDIDRPCYVDEKMVEILVRQLGTEIDYVSNKKNIDFIAQWQKLFEENDSEVSIIAGQAMNSFLNYFNNDLAVYIRCIGDEKIVYYNNTGIDLTEDKLQTLIDCVPEYPNGFTTSKIGDTFSEHSDVISIFGENEVFAFASVPIFNKGRLEALFITYVLMVDNWHNSFNRMMFSNDDLSIYNLLFKNLEDGISRIEANRQVSEMNKLLEKNSVTDILTGLYNRFGLYREIKKITESHMQKKLSVMFIDLDNFKPYNDTYGHDIGDIVLQKMAEIFNKAGEGGIVCRYGGDEFIILLETTDREELIQRAELIYSLIKSSDGFRAEIQELIGKKLDKNACNIGCSIGIATGEQIEGDDIDNLIKLADDMLYSIKLKNKGTYAFL